MAQPHSATRPAQHRDVDPPPFAPALQGELGELHALGALEQVVMPGSIGHHVANEVLPLQAEAVAEDLGIRYGRPLIDKLHRLRLVRVPHGAWSIHPVLGHTASQTGNGRPVGAIDVESDQVVPVYPRGPGRVDLSDNTAFELEGCITGIIGVGLVTLSAFIDAFVSTVPTIRLIVVAKFSNTTRTTAAAVPRHVFKS